MRFFSLSLSLSNDLALANVSNDQVQSQHIREADGTSGQNTNAGAGVKTGHIQNGAVSSAKILDGGVATSDLADSCVTSDKLTDGAVTDSKLTGPISATKIEKAAHVVAVAMTGGDFNSIQAALDAIEPGPDAPYLIQVMPGFYTSCRILKNYVTIRGAGKDVTTVTFDPNFFATVYLYDVRNVEVSGFTLVGGGIDDPHVVVSLGVSEATIENNVITNAMYGMVAGAGTVRHNEFTNVKFGIQTPSGVMRITDNAISCNATNSYGIQVHSTASHQVLRNVISGCTWDTWTDSTNTSNISFNVYDTTNYLPGPGGAFNVKSSGMPR